MVFSPDFEDEKGPKLMGEILPFFGVNPLVIGPPMCQGLTHYSSGTISISKKTPKNLFSLLVSVSK